MNKDQLASVVASEVGLSQSDAKAAVDAVFDGITNGMKNGDKVSIAGLDSLSQDTGLLDRVEIQQLEKQSRLLQKMHTDLFSILEMKAQSKGLKF